MIMAQATNNAIDDMAALPEELVEEIFLHVPPDEPAILVHAALVCNCNSVSPGAASSSLMVTAAAPLRRFHKTPPLLGYIHKTWVLDSSQPLVSPHQHRHRRYRQI